MIHLGVFVVLVVFYTILVTASHVIFNAPRDIEVKDVVNIILEVLALAILTFALLIT